MLSTFQPFRRPSILTNVVDHFTNRLNSYRQFWLIIGIITVGLLDLGLTTFIGLEDLSAMPFVLPINERAHSPAALSPDLFIDQDALSPSLPDATVASAGSVNRVRKDSRNQADRRGQKTGVIPKSSVALLSSVPVNCRTVKYPFVGENIVVRVTDEVGCLSSQSLPYTKDQSIAKVFHFDRYANLNPPK